MILRVSALMLPARLALPVLLGIGIVLATPALGAANEKEAVSAAPSSSLNIALRANGGKFELANPPAEDKFNLNLNDGYSTDWRAREKKLPQDLVFSFFGGRTALVDRVVVDSITKDLINNGDAGPRSVEIAVSTTSPVAGFDKVASTELPKKAGRNTITFLPTPARFLRVRITSTHGQTLQLAEIEAYEAAGQPSVLADRPLELAAAGNGGSVVRFSEPCNDAAWLIDGSNRGWHTDSATKRADIFFAFRGAREALIERIVLEPRSQHPADTMARSGKIFLSSSTSPLEGFEEAAEFTIGKDGRDVSVPIGRRARFVKLAITGNHGGRNTSLGEVRVIEGTANGYRSIFSEPERTAAATNAPTLAGESENEPNNNWDQAGVLFVDAPLRGQIKPLGDEDFFALEIDKPKFPELSIELSGRPYIRTSLELYQGEKLLAQFDPTNAAGESVIIKFPVVAGTYGIRVFEPPTSLLLVYDASSSMRDSMANLRVAVDAYVDQLRPSVLVNLVRFDSATKVLLPEFTSDQAKLKAAIAQNFSVGKGTAFFDAVDQGCNLLKNAHGNRVMLLMTDGADSSSKTNYIDFWKLVEAHKIRLYTVGFGLEMELLSDKLGTSPRRMLDHIALATHGRSFMTDDPEELKNLYERVSDEIRQVSGYSLLAFWGEEPPKPEAQATAAAAARKKALSGSSKGLKYFLLGLIGLVLVSLLVGLILVARGGSGKRDKRTPINKQYRK